MDTNPSPSQSSSSSSIKTWALAMGGGGGDKAKEDVACDRGAVTTGVTISSASRVSSFPVPQKGPGVLVPPDTISLPLTIDRAAPMRAVCSFGKGFQPLSSLECVLSECTRHSQFFSLPLLLLHPPTTTMWVVPEAVVCVVAAKVCLGIFMEATGSQTTASSSLAPPPNRSC